ncbi:D-alanine--D-alanine ligase family protein [Puniceicoccus vermicola]|uniref:D-alanine--D-alanine ligase n=1 Tax=Puniceicoccus vermicola TaxID=388746 RepID=A0A7X1B1Y6_9BACT|nr:D-alanine--D-alanine ligase [Puniceicoccus vermicola]MBC2603984.1 D-alanine--D-alanine ligase [Puniceicoccus vermicola]
MKDFAGEIAVLYGGVGAERDVSIVTGKAVLEALSCDFKVRGIELREASLPKGLDPRESLIFPALHGEFGEDGGLQSLLEKGGFEYSGSDSISSALCMNKAQAKKRADAAGVRGADSMVLSPGEVIDCRAICEKLGRRIVVKPVDGGSSTFLSIVEGAGELQRRLDTLPNRHWLLESFIEGREVSIGILNGLSMGVVEIVPQGGVYDYEHKYTAGKTEYRSPAVLEPDEESMIRHWAETVFAVCGCRDFARVDFRLSDDGPRFLEINTIPGLTAESLLPKSAACRGLSFEDLAVELVSPAVNRFQRRRR